MSAMPATSSASASEPTQRAVPYHCPFCAEEDLRPVASGTVPGLTRGGWHCRSCLRVFSLSFLWFDRFPSAGPDLESDES